MIDIDDLHEKFMNLLTQGDEVPCDGVILEGECIIGNSMVSGSLNEINKKALDNNNNFFNYKNNKY